MTNSEILGINRRTFVAAATAAAVGVARMGQANPEPAKTPNDPHSTAARPLIISTWDFGLPGNERALAVINQGGTTLDGVEQGIRHVEAAGGQSVGLSGRPNSSGYVQLDACIMHGPGHLAGAVAAIEGIVHPITAARRVMEKTKHVMLVGEGARQFALAQGLESVDIQQSATPPTSPDQQPSSAANIDNHDTITMLILGTDGTVSGGCSTSGLADKLPGRVGDSPIIGSGLYVDNEIGAAGATGIGENVMRYCATFMIVEFMSQGLPPADACRKAIDRISRSEPKGKNLSINFIALDKRGRFGAAGTGTFPYAVTYPGFSQVLKV
jgi:isoaspartyl peptidase/L-asparaginase-like protein (Ntn-hydrolase superfamily)